MGGTMTEIETVLSVLKVLVIFKSKKLNAEASSRWMNQRERGATAGEVCQVL